MEIIIRKATEKDTKALGHIHSASWKEAYKGIIPQERLDNITPEKREIYFQRVIEEGREENVLLFADGVAAGFICIGKCRDEDVDGSFGEIWGLYFLPEYWDRGLGRKLFEWGVEELKRRGYEKITLWVLEENYRARRFYEKMGFTYDTSKEIVLGKSLIECRYLLDL